MSEKTDSKNLGGTDPYGQYGSFQPTEGYTGFQWNGHEWVYVPPNNNTQSTLPGSSPSAPGGGGGAPLGNTPAATTPPTTNPPPGGGWMGTAGKVLPWLQFANNLYQSQRKGKYQPVPLTPEQRDLYNWSRNKVNALPDVNKALYPTAINNAMSSPSLDMDALRAGKPGAYTAPQRMPFDQSTLASVLGGTIPGASAAPAATAGSPTVQEILKWYYSTYGQPGGAGGAGGAPIMPAQPVGG